jgi:outer membrane lipoprotein-sorting protein
MARLLRSRSMLAAAVAAVVLVAGVAFTAAGASTTPDLTPIPADRLIASALTAVADPSLSVSGTFETHVDLGIPQLPAALADPAGPVGLLLSDQTFRVWHSPDGVRVAQLLPAAERDAILTDSDVWLWDSTRFAAWHATLPGDPLPTPSPANVDAILSQFLPRLEPYADLTTSTPIEVANRPVYVLRLTPASSPDTLVDRVEFAIDAATRVPLRVEVFAQGLAEPVAVAGYTNVSFGPVDPAIFDFTPPAGAPVHEIGGAADGGGDSQDSYSGGGFIGEDASHDAAAVPPGAPEVRWIGAGFDVIVAVSGPSVPKDLAPFFPYRGPIASADVVERGDHAWVVAGLVRPDALAKVEPKLT